MTRHTQEQLALRYAQAYLAVYQSALSDDDCTSLQAAARMIQTNKRLLFFLRLPIIKKAVKETFVQQLISMYALPQSLKKLGALLIAHDRLCLLPTVLNDIVSWYRRTHAIYHFTIASSHALPSLATATIEQFLSRLLPAATIKATTTIDAALIAGIRLQSDRYRWEYSVRKKCNALRLLSTR